MQKTEQKTEQQAGLGMSFCEEEGRITVFRKTLEALEWPSHYRFLYNRKMKQIAVQACGAEEAGAHRVGKLDESAVPRSWFCRGHTTRSSPAQFLRRTSFSSTGSAGSRSR